MIAQTLFRSSGQNSAASASAAHRSPAPAHGACYPKRFKTMPQCEDSGFPCPGLRPLPVAVDGANNAYFFSTTFRAESPTFRDAKLTRIRSAQRSRNGIDDDRGRESSTSFASPTDTGIAF